MEIVMASVLAQFRTNEQKKKQASEIWKTLGIELSDYLRLCMTRLILEGGLPFGMDNKEAIRLRTLKAWHELSDEAKRNGTSNLTLDEINKEMDEVRKGGRNNEIPERKIRKDIFKFIDHLKLLRPSNYLSLIPKGNCTPRPSRDTASFSSHSRKSPVRTRSFFPSGTSDNFS